MPATVNSVLDSQPMKAAAFLLGSGILVFVSRRSLGSPRSHGFFRFFAWECILVIFLLNLNFWFSDPWSWIHLVSWSLLILSLIPLAFGVHSLRTKGAPASARSGDDSLLAFEKTTTVVTSGIYQYIRHPLYSSLLLLLWGIFFKAPGLTAGALALTGTVFLFATARADERECLAFFGEPYRAYMNRSKRFIPFLF